MGLQALAKDWAREALNVIYPPQCHSCGAEMAGESGLCGACWREVPFIGGAVCECCGMPLPGESGAEGLRCDQCLQVARPWSRGRSALLYAGRAKALVLALKHGDRLDLAEPAAAWMAQAAGPLLAPDMLPDMLIVPIPLHWSRLWRRRFNQSALLSAALARRLALDHLPDLLQRPRATKPLEGHDRAARFAALEGALRLNPRLAGRLRGRRVLLVDDVMTSGATLAAGAETCLAGGAAEVNVLTLARVPLGA